MDVRRVRARELLTVMNLRHETKRRRCVHSKATETAASSDIPATATRVESSALLRKISPFPAAPTDSIADAGSRRILAAYMTFVRSFDSFTLEGLRSVAVPIVVLPALESQCRPHCTGYCLSFTTTALHAVACIPL